MKDWDKDDDDESLAGENNSGEEPDTDSDAG